MVEIAPFAVIVVASVVAMVSLFSCGYLYAQMRMDRKQDESAPYVPRHAAGVAQVLTIHPGTERGISRTVPFHVSVKAAA